ncbi:MAG: VWA domain-containing protein [Planctomycetota bacterium]|nr:MAG: VWA domain-containing protein [Planctomycetota bacterium]
MANKSGRGAISVMAAAFIAVALITSANPCRAGEPAAAAPSGYDIILAVDFSRSSINGDPVDFRTLVPSLVFGQLKNRPGDRVAVVPIAGWNETTAANVPVLLNWTEIPKNARDRKGVIAKLREVVETKFTPFGRATDYNRAVISIRSLLDSRGSSANKPWLFIISDGQMDVIESHVRPEYEAEAKKRYGKVTRETVNKAAFDIFVEKSLPRLADAGLRLTLLNTDLSGRPSPVYDAIRKAIKNKSEPKNRGDLVMEVATKLAPSNVDITSYPLSAGSAGKVAGDKPLELPFHLHQGTRELTLVLTAVRGNFEFELFNPGGKKITPGKEPRLTWQSPTKRYITLKMHEMPWGDYRLKLFNKGKTGFAYELLILGTLEYKTDLELKNKPRHYLAGDELEARFALRDYAGSVVKDPAVMDAFGYLFHLTPPEAPAPQKISLGEPKDSLEFRYKYRIPEDTSPGTGKLKGRFTTKLKGTGHPLSYVTPEANASFTIVCEAVASFAKSDVTAFDSVELAATLKGTLDTDEFNVQLSSADGKYKRSVILRFSGEKFTGYTTIFEEDGEWSIKEQYVLRKGQPLVYITPGEPGSMKVSGALFQYILRTLKDNIPLLAAIGVLLLVLILMPRFGKQFFATLNPEDETRIESRYALKTLPKKFGVVPTRLGPAETGNAMRVTCGGIRGATSIKLSAGDADSFQLLVTGQPLQGKHRLSHLDEIIVENMSDGTQMRIHYFEREPSEDEILSLSGEPLADDEIILVDEGLTILT